MARPRVFISSTFYNLKQVRTSLEEFVRTMGYDPVITDNITYLPDQPLDESCYLEAASCDLFVLIVGGRYGSEVSSSDSKHEKDFYDRYKSITRKEFESALQRDVPIYVLVDRSVQSDYRTFQLNRDNESVKYAHVDSVNVFELVEFIKTQTHKPVREFEKATDIVEWLKEQWGGLFQKMLASRGEAKRLSSLERQVLELDNVATTMKRYLEEMVGRGAGGEGQAIIAEEQKRLENRRLENQLESVTIFLDLRAVGVSSSAVLSQATSFEDLASRVVGADIDEEHRGGLYSLDRLITHWRIDEDRTKNINQARSILKVRPLEFESTGKG